MEEKKKTTVSKIHNNTLLDYQDMGMKTFAERVRTFIDQYPQFKTRNLSDGRGKGGSVKAFCRHLAKSTGEENDTKLISSLSQGFNTYLKEERGVPIGRLIATANLMNCSTDYLLGLTDASKRHPLETAASCLGFDLRAAQHLTNQRLAAAFPNETLDVTTGEDGKEYWQYVFANEKGETRTYEELSQEAMAAGLKDFSLQPPGNPLPPDYLDILNLLFSPLDENDECCETVADLLIRYVSACALREQDRLLHRREWSGPDPNERLLALQQKLEHVAARYAKEESRKTQEIKAALNKGLPTEEDYLDSFLNPEYGSPEDYRARRLRFEADSSKNTELDKTAKFDAVFRSIKDLRRDKSEFEKRTGVDHPEKLPPEKRYQAYPAKYPRSEVPLHLFDNEGNVIDEETANLYAILKKEGVDTITFWSGSSDVPEDPEYTIEALHDRIDRLQTMVDALEKDRAETDSWIEEMHYAEDMAKREAQIKDIMKSRGIKDFDEAARIFDDEEEEALKRWAKDMELARANGWTEDEDEYEDDYLVCPPDPDSYSSEMYAKYYNEFLQNMNEKTSPESRKKSDK